MDEKLLKKAKETKTVEELKALAGQNNFYMDDDKAEKYFAHLHSNEALSEDELENISGGSCLVPEPKYYYEVCPMCQERVKIYYGDFNWECPKCGFHVINY